MSALRYKLLGLLLITTGLVAGPAVAQNTNLKRTTSLTADGPVSQPFQAAGKSALVDACGPPWTVGGIITLTGTISQEGDIPSEGVRLEITVGTELAFIDGSGTADRGSWAISPQSAILTVGTMHNETINYSIQLEAVNPGQGTLTDMFYADGSLQDTDECTYTVELPPPNVEVQKTASAGPDIPLGSEFSYTIFVANSGAGPASDLQLTDALPATVSYRSVNAGAWTCNYADASHTLTCTLASLAPGASAPVTVDVTASSLGNATNTAVVGEKSSTVEASIVGEPNIEVQKTASAGPNVPVGTSFTYTVTVTNTGNATAQNVTLNDPVPTTVTFHQATTSKGTCSFDTANHTLDCTLGDVAPGEVVTVTIDVTGSVPGNATNIVYVGDESANVELSITETDSGDHDILGRKFVDWDGDGLQGAFEPGLNGVTIELLDEGGNVIAQDVTGSEDIDGDGTIDPDLEQGRFEFLNLPDGTYTLREVVPAGYTQTAPAAPGTYTFTLPGSQLPDLFLFGNQPPTTKEDFGDLPEPRTDIPPPGCPAGVTCYPTTWLKNGPSHILTDEVWLGATVDDETDGQPTGPADGDDGVNPMTGDVDDEDGLVSAAIRADGSIQLVVIATIQPPLATAVVEAWIDLNDDGDFAGEKLFAKAVTNGLNTLSTGPGFKLPDEWIGYIRLRISKNGGLSYTGNAPDGEVEDYYIVGMDFGDAPESADPNRPDVPSGYPTRLEVDGARHIAVYNVRLGDDVDPEGQAKPDISADGDDDDTDDDEDGILFENGFTPVDIVDPKTGATVQRHEVLRGSQATFTPLASVDGRLSAWIDWNRDGDWDDDGETVVDNVLIDGAPTYSQLTISIPETADPGITFARFRFSRNGGLDATGPAPDGEVEDHLLVISATGVGVESTSDVPARFALHPNYPNPFNPATEIRFDVAARVHVMLRVYDVQGRLVETLVDASLAPGRYAVTFDARNLPSGVYLYAIQMGDVRHVQKMVLLK